MVTSEYETKVRPPRTAAHAIRRQPLIDTLHRSLDAGVVLISAPAGYGKTTLVADFCRDLDIPVCWYSIDRSDQDIEFLVAGILASIRLHFPHFGKLTAESLSSEERGPRRITRLAEALARDMREDIPDYFLLVLDDYHLAEEGALRGLLDVFFACMPDNCHVIAVSRTAIELAALPAMLLHGRASRLTVSDLAFSREETKQVFSSNGLALPEADLDVLVRDTEGWPASVVLHLQQAKSGQPVRCSSEVLRTDVFGYLGAEVYESLPPGMRSFLLQSSVLEEIEPDFCDRLLAVKNSKKLLREIQRRNLFLSAIRGGRLHYRYHPLFREFLQETFAERHPEQLCRLHNKAARMFKREARWQQAIDHFISAGSYAQAKDVIRSVGQDSLNQGKWTTVSRWIERLPASNRSDPELSLLKAESDVHTGHVDEAARSLSQVIETAGQPGDWLLLGRALSWRSAAHRLAGHPAEARKDIKHAISVLETNRGPADSLGDAYRRLGVILVEQGSLAAGLANLKKALKHYSSIFDTGRVAAVHNALGVAYKRRGDMVSSAMHLDFARQAWERIGNTAALAPLLNNLGLVYQCQGDYDRALDTLRAGLDIARSSGYRRMEACILISIADVLRDLGRYDDALSTYQTGLRVAEEVAEVYYIACATAGIGETHRLLGHSEQAELLLKQARSQAVENDRPLEEAVFSVRLGIIEYERGDSRRALSTLRRALASLRRMGDKETMARAHFHIANAAFLLRDYAGAKTALAEAARLADQLGYDGFLSVEGRHATLLLQYAASGEAAGGRFVHALSKVKALDAGELKTPAPVTVGPARQTPEIFAYAFGDGRVLVNGRKVRDADWRSARAKELFFYLLCSETAKTKEQAAVALWPDLSPAKSTSNFHINLFRARHALFPGVIALEEGSYRISDAVPIWFDVSEFLTIAGRIDDVASHQMATPAMLERAAAIYTGPFLPSLYSEWGEEMRRRLETQYLKVLRALALSYAKAGEFVKAIAQLEKIAAIDPYCEDSIAEIETRIVAGGGEPVLRELRWSIARLRNGDTVGPSPKRLASPNL